MALVRNPEEDTLGLAARLTGIPERRLVAERWANLCGGAAVLAHSQGRRRPEHPHGWAGAVAGPGGHGPRVRACSGIGSGGRYAEEVEELLATGFTRRLRSGELVRLAGHGRGGR
jgi:hypothetical protein